MSQQQFFINDNSPPPGFLTKLTPDSGIAVVPDGSDNISIKGIPTGVNQSTPDSNFETFNAGASQMQIAHRYQKGATTVGLVTTTILSIPLVANSCMNIVAQLAGVISAGADGVGGEVRGTVLMAALGTANLINIEDKVVRATTALSAATFDIGTDVTGTMLIVNVTGVTAETIKWYVIAEIVNQTF